MGLGPRGTSLLKRLSLPTEVDFTFVAVDQVDRSQMRLASRIKAGKKAPVKPLAPVEQTSEKSPEGERLWRWRGEAIASKGLEVDTLYTSDYIRGKGFKLPKLEKPAKEKKRRRESDKDKPAAKETPAV